MTTLYVFHSLIEATPTSDTVVLVFGQLWDGDAGGGGFEPAWAANSNSVIIGGMTI